MDENPTAQTLRELQETSDMPSGTPQTPPQVTTAPVPTESELDDMVANAEPDELDREIARAIAPLVVTANESFPSPRHNYNNAEDIFLIHFDGDSIPVRIYANFEVSLGIESREEYPRVAREYVNQISQQIRERSRILGRHFRKRFAEQLRREIVTQQVTETLRTQLSPVAFERAIGRLTTIVDNMLHLMQLRREEAVAVQQRQREREAREQRAVARNLQVEVTQGPTLLNGQPMPTTLNEALATGHAIQLENGAIAVNAVAQSETPPPPTDAVPEQPQAAE